MKKQNLNTKVANMLDVSVIFKYSLTILSALTCFALVMFFLFNEPTKLANAADTYPTLTILVVIILVIWAALLLIISLMMLFSEQKRDQAFYMTAHTKIRDELEEKAVTDAIKRTFTFNLAFLTFIFALSGFQYGQYIDDKGEQRISFGFTIFGSNKEKSGELFEKYVQTLPKKEQIMIEEKGFSFGMVDDIQENTDFLIPRETFSSIGVLFLIFLQFAAFKSFLFLNLRALSSDEDE